MAEIGPYLVELRTSLVVSRPLCVEAGQFPEKFGPTSASEVEATHPDPLVQAGRRNWRSMPLLQTTGLTVQFCRQNGVPDIVGVRSNGLQPKARLCAGPNSKDGCMSGHSSRGVGRGEWGDVPASVEVPAGSSWPHALSLRHAASVLELVEALRCIYRGVDRIQASVGRSRASFGRIRPSSGQIRPKSGRTWSKPAHCWSIPGQFRSSWADVGASMAEIGSNLADLGPSFVDRSKSARNRPNWVVIGHFG